MNKEIESKEITKKIDFKQVNPIIYPDTYYDNLLRKYNADKSLDDKSKRYEDLNEEKWNDPLSFGL